MTSARRLEAREEIWPLANAFRISRGAKTAAQVIVAEISQGGVTGRGEAVPYARYDETVAGVRGQIEAMRSAIEDGLTRADLSLCLPAGAARNALDCALWDLEAKTRGVRAWTLAGLPDLNPVKTAFTLSLDTPEKMGEAARAAERRPLLKLKIGGADDLSAVEAVRAGAPRSRLIVDANEALDIDTLNRLAPDFERLGVKMIEQPLPAGDDDALSDGVQVTGLGAMGCHDCATLVAQGRSSCRPRPTCTRRAPGRSPEGLEVRPQVRDASAETCGGGSRDGRAGQSSSLGHVETPC